MPSYARRLIHVAPRVGYYLLYTATSAAFFAAMTHYFSSKQFTVLATLCAPVLAVLFAFAALLYNRARALPNGKEQRRSLYAAERAMQGAAMFLLGVLVGGVGSLFVWSLPDIGNKSVHPYVEFAAALLILGAILLFLFAFGSFFMALRTVTHSLVRWLPIRTIVRGLRNDA